MGTERQRGTDASIRKSDIIAIVPQGMSKAMFPSSSHQWGHQREQTKTTWKRKRAIWDDIITVYEDAEHTFNH